MKHKIFPLLLSAILALATYVATASPLPANQDASTGRIIGYLPAWKSLPSAEQLKDAGYTDILVAFGLFSSTTGLIVDSAFAETVTPEYIKSLQNAGMKVLLSVGGAQSSIATTTVNFHDAYTASKLSDDDYANSLATNFINNFVTSPYHFDGIDIDIEQGLDAANGDDFSNPTGDVGIMIKFINKLHALDPNLLISLVPQAANIAPSRNYIGQWANYSAIINQVNTALSWVGIQLYNSGGMYGVDNKLYDPNAGDSMIDFSTAMAINLMEPWPSQVNSVPTYFLPFKNTLRPDQVVLGYPSMDNNNSSDGQPGANLTRIKRAIACLTTGKECLTYQPPHTYTKIGGVFDWEVSYDQTNNFSFAKGLKTCVTTGDCR